ncbi:DUF6900 domain-containing protein [Achromobacter xylosoxidans]|uniref:DUF6900 domain-containing protein n=1 Tax=Achromobacter ruhlandii TaxID=72557 RepID=UPI003B9A8F52
MATPTLSTAAQAQILAIAESVLGLETLETRRSDSLDFHDLAVWTVKSALQAAYLAGMVDHHHGAVSNPIERSLTDYLSGYTRNNPAARAHVIAYADWPRMARVELDRRASGLLSVLPDEELRAIADGQVSLPALARKLPA